MRSLSKLLFLFFAIIQCGIGNKSSVADKELECYSQEKVYHEESGKCFKLLTKGPCEAGEWLVLERTKKNEQSGRIKPVCSKEKCAVGEYFWPSTRTCIDSKGKAKVCKESDGEELVNNVFGEGECSCTREPPRARLNGEKNKPCYQLYTRGPCDVGKVVAFRHDETVKATCVRDPCHAESVKRKKEGNLAKDGILAPSENGTCYELGTQGPCAEDLVFKVHAGFLIPSCASLTTTIFSNQKPQNCNQDQNGDCQKRVPEKKKGAQKFKDELLSSIKN